MTHLQFAAALREIADLYENSPAMIPPDKSSFWAGQKRDVFAGMVRALGSVEKIVPKSKDDFWYLVEKGLPCGITVEFAVPRDAVCKRVQKLELVEAWECSDSLLAETSTDNPETPDSPEPASE